MPKEITHWLIADEVAKTIAASDKIFCARGLRPYLYIGAVLHDTPYYRLGRLRPDALQLADRLHGAAGEDTFNVIRCGIQAVRQQSLLNNQNLENAYRALLLGMITHICADTVFHPFVYYVSGNLHTLPHQAWRNHRRLESALDLTFCRAFHIEQHKFLLHKYVRQCEQNLENIFYNFFKTTSNERACIDVLSGGLRTLARVRRLGTNSFFESSLNLIEPHLPMHLQAYTALRYTTLPYTRENTFVSNIDAQFPYHHPTTNEIQRTTLRKLFDTSVRESLSLWKKVDDCLRHKREFTEYGASLETGYVGVASQEMKFFDKC